MARENMVLMIMRSNSASLTDAYLALRASFGAAKRGR